MKPEYLTIVLATAFGVLCLAGCSKDNPVVGHLNQDPACVMPPCPPGQYCVQQCPP